MQWSDFIYGSFYGLHVIAIEIIAALAISALIVWSLIIEHYLYFVFNYKSLQEQYLQRWQQTRHCRTIAERRLLKAYYLSECRLHGERGIGWIQQLGKISLLLGLLGTVLGLISVFESQLLSTSDTNRHILNGISYAIIPTVAGLLISLSALFCTNHLQNMLNNAISRLDSSLIEL